MAGYWERFLRSLPALGTPDATTFLRGDGTWISVSAGSVAASAVSNVPAGAIAATDVQAALNELDTEKANTGHVHAAADVTSGTFALARIPVAASGVSSATLVVRADDARLSDARAPSAHVHAAADVTSGVFGLARLPVALSGVSSATDLVRADDSRLSDARTPTAHNQSATTITTGTLAIAQVPVAASGVSSTTLVVRADDSRLSDARTPAAHVHAAADITTGTIATARLGSGTASSTTFLRGDQTYAVPAVTAAAVANTPAGTIAATTVQAALNELDGDIGGKAATVHTHAAADITSGTMATARLGSGTANANTFLNGAQAYAAPLGLQFVVKVTPAYDPPSVGSGGNTVVTVTATGAALGDFALVGFSLNTNGWNLFGMVTNTNTVSVRLTNITGGTVDLGAGTLTVVVLRAV